MTITNNRVVHEVLLQVVINMQEAFSIHKALISIV
jgi:hypothetical protein